MNNLYPKITTLLQTKKAKPDLKEMPNSWYNFVADIDKYGVDKEKFMSSVVDIYPNLAQYFPEEIIRQEQSGDKWIKIPQDVQDYYRMWRPTPLIRAIRFEKIIGTKCNIYYKNETISPTGSYKLNTAIPQAYYYKAEGAKSLVADTGAGHWAMALSYASKLVDLPVTAFMVNQVDHLKPIWKKMLELQGMKVHLSPSMETSFGRKQIEGNVTQGTLGIAISEALEFCHTNDAKYVSGCLFNHVLLHQSIIGLEAVDQFKDKDIEPDFIVGSCGGGSNLGGLCLPFINPELRLEKFPKIDAVESTAYPTLTEGTLVRESIDSEGNKLYFDMYTLGRNYTSKQGAAGGLRYYGVSPIISQLVKNNLIYPFAYDEAEAIDAAKIFAASEGIIPAIESSFALRHIIEICKNNEDEEKIILFNLSGNGYSDIDVYVAADRK